MKHTLILATALPLAPVNAFIQTAVKQNVSASFRVH